MNLFTQHGLRFLVLVLGFILHIGSPVYAPPAH